MGTDANQTGEDLEGIVSNLTEVSRIDTLYRDLYLQRAADVLSPVLSSEGYRLLKRMQVELASLPNEIRNAMERGEWRQVQELSEKHRMLKQEVEGKRNLESLGKEIYEDDEFPLDPFSPGMQSLAGTTMRALPDLRQKGVRILESLIGRDTPWREFYSGRLTALKALTLSSEGKTETTAQPTSANLQQEALEALESGDFDKLQEVAGNLSKGGQTAGLSAAGSGPGESRGTTVDAPPDFDFTFPGEVVQRARTLGLVPEKTESSYREFAHLLRFVWHPTFSNYEMDQSGAMRVSNLPFAPDTPEAMKKRAELFAMHPFVNSAGIRLIPKLVGEDLLVEDFEEPAEGKAAPGSALLEALGLPRRSGLSRLQLEKALTLKGPAVLRDGLGLDPVQFRLVCIPPDVHLRLGLKHGWGGQKLWTHFDGYMVKVDGKLLALAGGDVRFGGIYDMVGIGRNYESDNVIVRFAVVQRKRMTSA
jgi:hypothetical protein